MRYGCLYCLRHCAFCFTAFIKFKYIETNVIHTFKRASITFYNFVCIALSLAPLIILYLVSMIWYMSLLFALTYIYYFCFCSHLYDSCKLTIYDTTAMQRTISNAFSLNQIRWNTIFYHLPLSIWKWKKKIILSTAQYYNKHIFDMHIMLHITVYIDANDFNSYIMCHHSMHISISTRRGFNSLDDDEKAFVGIKSYVFPIVFIFCLFKIIV